MAEKLDLYVVSYLNNDGEYVREFIRAIDLDHACELVFEGNEDGYVGTFLGRKLEKGEYALSIYDIEI